MGVMHKALPGRILGAIAATALMAAMPVTASAQGLIRDAEIEKILRDYGDPLFTAAGIKPEDVKIYIVQDDSLTFAQRTAAQQLPARVVAHAENFLRAAQQARRQRGTLLLMRQIQTCRIEPRLRAQIGKQVTRQRDFWMRRAELAGFQRQLLRLLHRVRDQLGDRHAGVAKPVDKRGVGAVFEQAAH